MQIILASKSPRRKEILNRNGITPKIVLPSIDENAIVSESVEELVMKIALKKGQDVLSKISLADFSPNTLIISADTIVYKDRIIGKPKDRDDAISTLLMLRNTNHTVYTGVALIKIDGTIAQNFYDKAEVYFKDYSIETINDFIDQEPPFDKAGSYAAQGMWLNNIDHIDGDINTVIGLPWKKLSKYIC